MARKKQIEPGDTLPLNLSAPERRLVAGITFLPPFYADMMRATSGGSPVMLTLGDLEDLHGFVAAEANHTPDEKLQDRLDEVLHKIEGLLVGDTDEPLPAILRIHDASDAKPAPAKATASSRKPRGRKKAADVSLAIYQFKITLSDVLPAVWRRFQVPDCSLGLLHEVIQRVMGWDNYHLHQFTIAGVNYGPADPEDMDFGLEVEDEDRVCLSDLIALSGKRPRIRYVYDFGDGWRHEITAEKPVAAPPHGSPFVCLAGARACPPEDIGGPWGYADFLETIANPKHPEHKRMLEWIGGNFDSERFSIEEVNAILRESFALAKPKRRR